MDTAYTVWSDDFRGMIAVMALTDAQLAYYRSKLGSTIDEPDLETRYARLGNDAAVAAEVLDQRIADLLAKPASFSVPGEYSEDRSANIRALTATASDVRAELPGGGAVVNVVQPAYSVR